MGNSSNSFGIEHRPLPGAVALERALLADRVGALEDPVLPGGQAPKLACASASAAGGLLSPSWLPISIYERSVASTNSASVPAKHEPGSMSATSERDVRSTRLSTRFQSPLTSRASQCSLLASR